MLALILDGGSTKSYAHTVVIRHLEELHTKPQLIVDASMGALVSGFYAAGFNSAGLQGLSRGVNRTSKGLGSHRSKRPYQPSNADTEKPLSMRNCYAISWNPYHR